METITLFETKHSHKSDRRQYELLITSDTAQDVPVRINGKMILLDELKDTFPVPVTIPFLVAWRQEDTCVLLVEDGHRVLDKGKHTLIVTAGDASLTLTVKNNGKHNVSVEAK